MKPTLTLSLILLTQLIACSTPPDVGRVPADPFLSRNQNPIFVDVPDSWADTATLTRKPAFALEERVLIPSQEIVALDLRSTPLASAIQMIAEIAGVNIYLDAEHSKPIDASFPSIRLDEALEVVLLQNGLALEEIRSGVFAVHKSDGSIPTTARFELLSTHATDVAAQLKEMLGDEVNIVGDPALNVVLVQGTRAVAERAAEIVKTIDQRPAQVLIEVGIYEASIGDGFELGISHSFSDIVDGSAVDILQAFTTPDTQFSLEFANGQGSLTSTIQALRKHVGVELISSPRVMTTTNTEALVEVLEAVPYVNTTSTTTGTTGGVGSTVQEIVEFKEAGITMRVLPTIQGDGLVKVTIDQTVSEVVDFFNGVPVIDKQHLSTTFLVADGQTVVMGGLMQDRRRSTNQGIPILGSLPFVGRLFSSDVDATEKRELLVFLTPRVLDPMQAILVAKKYKQSYRESRKSFDLPMLAAGEGSN